jgi:hypothetical protein
MAGPLTVALSINPVSWRHHAAFSWRTLMENPIIIVLVIALIAACAVAGWLFYQKKQSARLQSHFGPEYDRALSEHHNHSEAERDLKERAERVEHLNIRPLSQGQRDDFAERWQGVQARFVDDPNRATDDADELVGEVMAARGYPVGDFEQRAADVSVNHPRVVEHYRVAHTIAMRNASGDADTEQLRQALVHFRALFEDLLEVEESDHPIRSRSVESVERDGDRVADRAPDRMTDRTSDRIHDRTEVR